MTSKCSQIRLLHIAVVQLGAAIMLICALFCVAAIAGV